MGVCQGAVLAHACAVRHIIAPAGGGPSVQLLLAREALRQNSNKQFRTFDSSWFRSLSSPLRGLPSWRPHQDRHHLPLPARPYPPLPPLSPPSMATILRAIQTVVDNSMQSTLQQVDSRIAALSTSTIAALQPLPQPPLITAPPTTSVPAPGSEVA